MKTPGPTVFSRAALLALLLSAPLAWGQSFSFTFTDASSNVVASGLLDVSGGLATTGSANVTGIDGFLPATFGLVSPSPVRALDGTDIIFDNQLFLSQPTVLNGDGLGFAEGLVSPGHYDYVLNLWGNSPGNYTLFEAGQLPSDPTSHVYNALGGSLNICAIPEPSTYTALFAAAVLGWATMRRRGRLP